VLLCWVRAASDASLRVHAALTGDDLVHEFVGTTLVQFDELSPEAIRAYIATGELALKAACC
jgi:predicted house-cleaning NTP pyrophosphatase (Maf/HAM1 superfamily)